MKQVKNYLLKLRFPFGWIFIMSILLSTTARAQEDISLEELLEMDLEKIVELQSGGRGEVGSFGYRLGTTNSAFQVHGYVTNEYIDQQGSTSTFDNHYYNLLLGSQIGGKIFAEIQLEYEHGGSEIQARYAQIDYKVSEAFIIRTGKFLVPINTFNEYLYPEYINKTISRSFMNRNITPSAWAEVGLQFRGNFDMSSSLRGFYSVFIVNGLEGDEGGDIRSMRGNDRDKNSDNKAVGGRFGVNTDKFEVGAGLYNGKYTADGQYGLTIFSADAGYVTDGLTIRAEVNVAKMETSVEDITRNGASATISYLIAEKFEPVVRYDFMNWDDATDPTKDKSRVYLGLNYLIANTMNAKVGYEIINNDGTDVDDNVFAVQLALGF
ncbi:MAG: hypothetical protein ABJF11_05825 [Reichenbachiella sp.]|uniref:hypothetical protein n=1 Tax=Reichenbachiella sp. TaxID=2184521 RepID=UPI003267B5AE